MTTDLNIFNIIANNFFLKIGVEVSGKYEIKLDTDDTKVKISFFLQIP